MINNKHKAEQDKATINQRVAEVPRMCMCMCVCMCVHVCVCVRARARSQTRWLARGRAPRACGYSVSRPREFQPSNSESPGPIFFGMC